MQLPHSAALCADCPSPSSHAHARAPPPPQLRWLPRTTLRTHPGNGAELRFSLRAATTRRPSLQASGRVRWFSNEALTVRVPLTKPDAATASVGGYSCPCGATGDGGQPLCPECAAAGAKACSAGPCCLRDECADKDLT